jgi:hypothetical protein
MFSSAMSTESTMEKCTQKKKFKGFPMFFTSKFFKTALIGDLKQWWSRHYRQRSCYHRRYRRSRSGEKRKRVEAKGRMLVIGRKKMSYMLRAGALPCVRR